MTECAQCLNLIITPCFWIILGPLIFPKLDFSKIGIFIGLHMFILHAFPIVTTTLNIWYTDMKIFKADWKLMIPLGFFYMYANALGTYDMGHVIYPIIDWQNIPV